MTTLCTSFTTMDDADAAVERLLAAGVRGDDIRVLAGESTRDHRDDPVGTYAGRHGAEDPVGSYADAPTSNRDPMGSYVGGGGGQRRGSFGDLDRDTVATYGSGVRRLQIASHRGLERMLVEAGLDEKTAETDVAALHRGRILVLARSGAATPEATEQALHQQASA
jgi:hypothetical protein